MLYAYFTGHKPEWLVFKVFAIASFYGEPKYLSMIQTNIIDEMGSIFTIFGLLITFFSQTRHEDTIINTQLRIKALVHSIWLVAILWAATFLLVYGYAIFFAATTAFGLFLLISNVHFYIQLILYKKRGLHK